MDDDKKHLRAEFKTKTRRELESYANTTIMTDEEMRREFDKRMKSQGVKDEVLPLLQAMGMECLTLKCDPEDLMLPDSKSIYQSLSPAAAKVLTWYGLLREVNAQLPECKIVAIERLAEMSLDRLNEELTDIENKGEA